MYDSPVVLSAYFTKSHVSAQEILISGLESNKGVIMWTQIRVKMHFEVRAFIL